MTGYAPFALSDICNWKAHSKGLREDPEVFLVLVGGIVQTHYLAWAGVQTLLNVLLTVKGKP